MPLFKNTLLEAATGVLINTHTHTKKKWVYAYEHMLDKTTATQHHELMNWIGSSKVHMRGRGGD